MTLKYRKKHYGQQLKPLLVDVSLVLTTSFLPDPEVYRSKSSNSNPISAIQKKV